MTNERVAAVLLILTPVWPALAAAALSFGRRPASLDGIARRDRECRTVAAAAALLACGSLLAALLIGRGATLAPSDPPAWISIPSLGIQAAFQLQLDPLSGPAGIAASLLSFVAVLAARRRDPNDAEHREPAYGVWMLLLCLVLILLLSADLVLLLAALIACELACLLLAPGRLSWVRGVTTLPLVWIALGWIDPSLFPDSRLAYITHPARWAELAVVQPILTLVSGLCLLMCVMGRMGLYPFCVDVDRAFDHTPGRLFWLGCLGSWIPAQYLLLRFSPMLMSSPLGAHSLTGIAALLTVLSAWLALTRPYRAGSIAMVGAGLLALTWSALGSGYPFITAVASLSLVLLLGGAVIVMESKGWLDAAATARTAGISSHGPNLADAGRRLFYLPELGAILTWPLRQIVELPANLESLRIPQAEIIGDVEEHDGSAAAEVPSSTAAAWLLPIVGLTSIAIIWALLLGM